MKDNKENIDELIKEALTAEEAKFYDDLGEQGLIGKLGGIHKGKLGWLAILMNIVHLLVFGIFVYCIVQFFDTEETNVIIKWTAAGFLCLVFMGMIKLFMWMQMDKNDILRELKRIELQIAILNNK